MHIVNEYMRKSTLAHIIARIEAKKSSFAHNDVEGPVVFLSLVKGVVFCAAGVILGERREEPLAGSMPAIGVAADFEWPTILRLKQGLH